MVESETTCATAAFKIPKLLQQRQIKSDQPNVSLHFDLRFTTFFIHCIFRQHLNVGLKWSKVIQSSSKIKPEKKKDEIRCVHLSSEGICTCLFVRTDILQ